MTTYLVLYDLYGDPDFYAEFFTILKGFDHIKTSRNSFIISSSKSAEEIFNEIEGKTNKTYKIYNKADFLFITPLVKNTIKYQSDPEIYDWLIQHL